MDGREGCCVARYTGGEYKTTKFERIMIRFRPIAPKPAMGGSVSGKSMPENSDITVRKGRAKRRYVRYGKKNSSCSRKKMIKFEGKKDGSDGSDVVVVTTLPLLQETPDRKDPLPASGSVSDLDLTDVATTPVQQHPPPIWLNFNNNLGGCSGSDRTVMMPEPVRPVGSCVIFECITDTCVDMESLGCTDEERKRSLERDTCPGFMSDSLNRVSWTNEAYRRMVGQGEGEEGRPEMVWLVMKEKLTVTYPAFACLIRLYYTRRKERNSMTVPCDVWRMDGGGFAWRLDVKAALSLGR